MNTEEKAKRYDEALERAKKWYNPTDADLYTCVAESIFPELKEPKNKRIREALIYHYQGDGCLCTNEYRIDYKDIRSWLEKQGEQDNNEDEAILHRFSFYSYKDEPNILYLAGLYVNDEYRNKGIGTKILKIADEVAASMKCSSILLKTKIGSNAERLYKNNGYITFKKEGNQVWLTKLSGSANSYCQENCKGFQETGKCFADGDCKAKRKAESTDKIESKFHEGEWVSNGDYTWKIIEVTSLDYILQSQDGNIVDDTISYVDEQFHSFSIEDAKDGDVLISQYNKPFIYNGNYNSFHIGSYCGISTESRFKVATEKCHWTENINIHPATKEQRNTLMKAMKEEGYEWSEETHELKKISQRIISAEAKEALYDKIAWSEEDETNLTNTIIVLKEGASLHFTNSSITPCVDWLKSLKNRVISQPDMVEALRTEYEKGKADGIAEMKKLTDIMDKDSINDFAYQCAYDLSKDWLYENASWDDVQIACKLGAKWYEAHHKVRWSERDEKNLQGIIDEIQANKSIAPPYDINVYDRYLSWLKSLRPQKQWKPTEEQMQALKDACGEHWEPDGLDPLYTLYEQLKMLTK